MASKATATAALPSVAAALAGPSGASALGGAGVPKEFPITAARAVARAAAPALLGGTDAEAAAVDMWCEAALRLSGADLAATADGALADRTYLAGAALTLADAAVHAALTDAGVAIAPGSALARWAALCAERLPAAAPAAAAAAPAGGDAKPKAAKADAKPAAAATDAAAAAPKKDAAAPKKEPAAVKAPKEGGGAGKGGANAPAASGKTPSASKNIGGGGDSGAMPALEGGEMGKVVTRFPPEPSGYLHIGHVKALLLNEYYARVYNGKLLIRFDDTNPSKEKDEYEQNIIADIAALGIVGDAVSHTSDWFDVICDYARSVIKAGKAYMDDTPREAMQDERMKMIDSKYRTVDPETNLARFEAMLLGGEEASKWCLRAKMSMQDPNGTCRDPVLYRVNETPHHRTGTKYKAYPTYDFACPIVDSLEGVTHALRSSEYHDRDVQYYRMQDLLGVRRVLIQDFSRLNFSYCLLSKRKLNWFVENKYVDGWYDPRFPTLQGMLRRGLVIPALREFILSQGASRRIVDMEWDKFWSVNKKHVDPVAPRFTALVAEGRVRLTLTEGEGRPAPGAVDVRPLPLHPKNADMGTKPVPFAASVWLEAEDAEAIALGEEVTLMKWGNARVTAIHRGPGVDGAPGAGPIVSMDAVLNLAGDFKKTQKFTWLADAPSAELVPLELVELDNLITVPKLEEGDDFLAAINPVTKVATPAVGEPHCRSLKSGDIVQLERKGFYRVDAPADGAKPATLIAIPDGKVAGMFDLAGKQKAAAAKAAARAAGQTGKAPVPSL